ncbi:MAG: hypothetical protein ACJ0QB_01760, partial [Flavobacteriaceae bacterium]
MKILQFNLILFFAFSSLNAQVISPTNPYTKEFVVRQLPSNRAPLSYSLTPHPTLKQIETSFDNYWADKNNTLKGSGFKPFKRWSNHWKDYLLDDGTIAPPGILWQAWEKKVLVESSSNPEGVPNIFWTNLGPSVIDNSATSTNGQGRINTVIKDPVNSQTLYVGAPAGGIWKSIDDGLNWIPLTDNLPQIGVSGIAIDPTNNNIIYIATGDDDAGDSYSIGVMKSLDGGQTWNTTGLQYLWTNYKNTNEIFIDPTDNNTIWVSTTDGLQKSSDGGDSWEIKLSGNIVDFRFQTGTTNSNTMFAVGFDSNNNSKFYRTTDGGENFQEISDIPINSNRIVLEVSAANPDKVYVLTAYDTGVDDSATERNHFQGVYVSNDAGLSFTKTLEEDDIFKSSQSWYDMALTVSDSDPDIVFVGVLDIWRSTDGGDNFTQINSWYQRNNSFTHADIHFLRYFDGVLYAGTDGGVYRSVDDGINFEDLSNTLSISQIYSLSISKNNSSKIASGLQDCGGFAYSNSEWNSYHGGDGMGTAVDPFSENTFYGMTQYGGNLYRTLNGGDNGSREFIASSPYKGQWETPLQFNKNGDLYAGYDQLYKLGGSGWDQVSNHGFDWTLRKIEMDPNNSNIIFVSTGNSVYKSDDRGKTFKNVLTTDYYYIRKIEVHSTNSNLVWVLTSNKIFKSEDKGETFTEMSQGLPSEPKRSFAHHPYSSDNAIYLGTVLGVYYTDDTLNDWYSVSSDLPNVKVSDMEINPNDNKLTISTYGRGIWQTPIPPVSNPNFDIDLLDISVNSNKFSCFFPDALEFDVYNNGESNINTFTYQTTVNGTENLEQQWVGTLPPGERLTIQKEVSEPFLQSGNIIEVDITLPSETITQNNILQFHFDVDLLNQSGETNAIYSYDQDEDNWLIVGDDLWEKGIPSGSDLNQVNSGQNAYATVLNGNYPNNLTSSLVSPCFNVSGYETATVSFYLAYQIESNYDYLYFEYSLDNGDTWSVKDSFTGENIQLQKYIYEFSDSLLQNNILFRFKMVADNYINFEGAVIDDFIIQATDTEAPVITLIGESTVSIDQDTTYSDQGATATDNVDGDITA